MYTIEELSDLSHEELCDMLTDGVINWSQWVLAQPYSFFGYEEWLEENGLEQSDEAARQFATKCEDEFMDNEMSLEQNLARDSYEEFSRMLADLSHQHILKKNSTSL